MYFHCELLSIHHAVDLVKLHCLGHLEAAFRDSDGGGGGRLGVDTGLTPRAPHPVVRRAKHIATDAAAARTPPSPVNERAPYRNTKFPLPRGQECTNSDLVCILCRGVPGKVGSLHYGALGSYNSGVTRCRNDQAR